MNLIKLKDNLYVPEDFENNHFYFSDPEGKKKYTGITSVIGVLAKPMLIPWAARMVAETIQKSASKNSNGEYCVSPELLEQAKSAHQRKKEEASTHGTDAHALVEMWIKGQMENRMSDVDFTPIQPFIGWALENVDHFTFSERTMANKDLFIAGTADFGCVMKDGKRLIGDFKTSSGVYGIDYFLQCAGYKILAEAEGDAPYDGAVIVRLGKKGPSDFDVHYRYATQSTKTQATDLWNRLLGFLGGNKSEEINYSDVDVKAFMACLTIYRAQATFTKPKYKTNK